jgi:hypothetical protein
MEDRLFQPLMLVDWTYNQGQINHEHDGAEWR